MDTLLYWFVTRTPLAKAGFLLVAVSSMIFVCGCGLCFVAALSESGDQGVAQVTATAGVPPTQMKETLPPSQPTPAPANMATSTGMPTSVQTAAPTLTPTQTPSPAPGSDGADLIITFNPGPGALPQYKDPENLLGDPDMVESPCCQGMVQLGRGGSVLLAFTDNTILDGDGPDFQVYGESARDDFLLIEVSENGQIWYAYQQVTESPGGLDLEGTGLVEAIYVRLTDVQPGTETGAELDAVLALHSGLGRGEDLPPLPDAAARGETALHEEPDESTSRVVTVSSGTYLAVLGRNGQSDWVKVGTPTGESGWCRLNDLDINVTLADVSVIQAP